MSKHPFKTTGILRAGFDYQDLIGIEVLLRFYRDPKLFNWVTIESDESEVRSLDDIVAFRKDDTYELYQVKFTSDPNKRFLDWGWLLHKEKNGSSLLQKWANTLKCLKKIHTAKLRTNRKPDSEFATSLNGNFVDFDRVNNGQKVKLITEFGGEEAARSFFEQFEFAHSEVTIDDLESRLKNDIVPTDTDWDGWWLLCRRVQHWATRRNSPEPDGKIRHQHLVQIINKNRPKPIPQDFTVPQFYQVSSDKFHKDFEYRIRTEPNQISVLWGPPGRGKSTYLSFLVDSLRKSDLPVVRHHYFLSFEDNTIDRVSFPEISISLISQIKTLYPDAVCDLDSNQPDQLRKYLEACGKHYAGKGQRFYLVIDGLDHVWRERQNISQMEHLFNCLLPCPKNVFLLIGTQKISNKQLPLKLIQKVTNTDWIEIPPMDERAVHKWIVGQYGAGRLLLNDQSYPNSNVELLEISSAFFQSCNGNPLHLIYSFEALVHREVAVTPEEISLLPSCPNGNIEKYYASLWSRLSTESQEALHLIAATDFQWPPDGLRKCTGPLDEVSYLLEHRRTGLIPFHGSITAFVRKQDNHQSTFQSVLPSLVDWLEHEAPEYWRWAWLWIMRAKSGNAEPLLTETTRNWVIQSLVGGWPVNQIIKILRTAEQLAFERDDYNRMWQLRSLKTRLQEGQEFQTTRFHDFQECALRISDNKQQITKNMADAVSFLTNDEIITLFRSLDGDDIDNIGKECCEEICKRFNSLVKLRNYSDVDFLNLAEYLIETAIEFGQPDPNKLLEFIERFDNRDNIFRIFLVHVVRTKNFDMAHGMLMLLIKDEHATWRNATENSIVQIACAEGIDLTHRLTSTRNISPLLSCWYRLKGRTPPQPCNLINLSPDVIRDNYGFGSNPSIEQFLHDFFFLALDAALCDEDRSAPEISGIEQHEMGWLQEAINHLWDTALKIAYDPNNLNYASIFIGLADLKPVDRRHHSSKSSSAQYSALRAVIGKIALDIHALSCAITGPSPVNPDTFETARRSHHWQDEIWIFHELEARRIWIDPAGVERLIDDIDERESKSVTSFNERSERWTNLAQLSSLYNLENSTRHLARAADCIIGYAWHGDIWIFDILSAIEKMHQADVEDVQSWLKALTPIIDQITTFTDGDETGHAPTEFVDLITKIQPEWLVNFYTHFIANEEYGLAEWTLGNILKSLNFSDITTSALISSLLERQDLYTLEDLQKTGRINTTKHLLKRKEFLGIISSRQKSEKNKMINAVRDNTADIRLRGKLPDVTKFGPDQLTGLLKRIHRKNIDYKHRDDCLVHWLRHWAGNNKGLVALKTIDDHFSTHTNFHQLAPLLDEAFEVSLEYEGKKKAYNWLVRAHIQRRGWNKYSSGEALIDKRLGLAAKHYKTKWRDFIRDTSKSEWYWEQRGLGFAVGGAPLVDFLLRVGQTDIAISFVNTLVQLVIEEVQDQPILPAKWLP